MAIFVKQRGVAHHYSNSIGLARLSALMNHDNPSAAPTIATIQGYIALGYDVVVDFDMGALAGVVGDGHIVTGLNCTSACFSIN